MPLRLYIELIMEEKVKIISTKTLSGKWGVLNEIQYKLKSSNGEWLDLKRESYDTGDGAAVLLYNSDTKKVILTKQFRLPTYLNGNAGGMLTEACAGLLDQDPPDICVIKEAEEETGYRISNPVKVFEAYMSPGSLTEIMHLFIAEYKENMKVSEGGGVEEEQEDIRVLEINFSRAWDMVQQGELKDAKTIILMQHLKLQGVLK